MKTKTLILLFTLIFSLPLASREAAFYNNDYEISLAYNDTAFPGDAVFVKMKFLQAKKSAASREEFAKTTGHLELYLDGKLLSKSEFYTLPDECSKGKLVLLTGIPLSSWWTEKDGYSLKVVYDLYGKQSYEFNLQNKEFVSETIELNAQNTGIKTDTSPERMTQIEKLNSILNTVTPSSVYQTKAFTAPTTATRRTSFFADRRVYAYSNGKSSTSLHYGIDYGIPEGSTVTSCADGKVVLAEFRISTGWSIVIEHLPGLYSLYYHLSSMNVKEGDMVKAGAEIGKSGSTGLATGPHLHWEMRLNMSAVSPDFFTGDFAFADF